MIDLLSAILTAAAYAFYVFLILFAALWFIEQARRDDD